MTQAGVPLLAGLVWSCVAWFGGCVLLPCGFLAFGVFAGVQALLPSGGVSRPR